MSVIHGAGIVFMSGIGHSMVLTYLLVHHLTLILLKKKKKVCSFTFKTFPSFPSEARGSAMDTLFFFIYITKESHLKSLTGSNGLSYNNSTHFIVRLVLKNLHIFIWNGNLSLIIISLSQTQECDNRVYFFSYIVLVFFLHCHQENKQDKINQDLFCLHCPGLHLTVRWAGAW